MGILCCTPLGRFLQAVVSKFTCIRGHDWRPSYKLEPLEGGGFADILQGKSREVYDCEVCRRCGKTSLGTYRS